MNDAAVPSPELCELLKAYEAVQREEKAIQSGLVSADEFKGAFEKTEKHYITVSQPGP